MDSIFRHQRKKKGQFGIGFVLIGVFLFVFALIFMVIMDAYSEVNDELQLEPNESLSQGAKDTLQDINDRYPATFDGAFGVVFVLLWIAMLASAYFFDTHPVFLVATIFLMIATLFIAGQLNNTYADIISDDDLTGIENSFPIINFVASNMMVLILVMISTTIIMMFARNSIG